MIKERPLCWGGKIAFVLDIFSWHAGAWLFIFLWYGPCFFPAKVMRIKSKAKKVYYKNIDSDLKMDRGLMKSLVLKKTGYKN